MQGSAELVPVQAAHRFDETKLAAYLARQFAEFKPPLGVQQFKGAAAPTFLLHFPGRSLVLRRRLVPRKGLSLSESIERDFHILQHLHKAGLPLGKPLLACADDKVIGAPFYLIEHVAGRCFRDPNLPGMDARQRQGHYEAMAQTLAEVHRIAPEATGIPLNGGAADYLDRQIAALTQQYAANRTDDIPAMERLLQWLPTNVPREEQAGLVHGNFRLDNLIFEAGEPNVAAILDWDLCTIGHPLVDLAINCMPYRSSIPGMGSLQGTDFIETGIPGEPDYVAAYCRHAGREGIQHWNFFLAFALFRAAVMAQGVYKRGMDKLSASAPAGPAATAIKAYGAVVRAVANQGWNLVDGGDD